MANLTEATIEQFRQLVKQEFDRDLSTREASEITNMLVDYFNLLAKIYHEENEQQ